MVKIIKFYGENCPGCKELDKFLESNDYKRMIHRNYNIDTELGADFAMEFGIRSVPALIKLGENNTPEDSVIGFDRELVENLLGVENGD